MDLAIRATLTILLVGGAAIAAAWLDRRRAQRFWADREALVLFFSGYQRLMVGAAAFVFAFAGIAGASSDEPWLRASLGAMALLAAATWWWLGRKVVVDAEGLRIVSRSGRATFLAWSAVEQCRFASTDLVLHGGERRIRVQADMWGYSAFGEWCARHLPAEVYARDVAPGHRKGWFGTAT